MQAHLVQIKHNQEFHTLIDSTYPGRFNDWKITILFYIANHSLKALASLNNIDIGNSHFDNFNNINPRMHNPLMPIDDKQYSRYRYLYKSSRSVRYDCIIDPSRLGDLKEDHQKCIEALNLFMNFIAAQGVVFL